MRATEIIRGVLDLIDQIECGTEQAIPAIVPPSMSAEPEQVQTGVDQNRFRQIFDILSAQSTQMYNNSPDPVVAGIDSVTVHAGGGEHGPKNPADIRADSVAMYPNYLHKPE
jgi:hypothetical protein